MSKDAKRKALEEKAHTWEEDFRGRKCRDCGKIKRFVVEKQNNYKRKK